MKFGVFNILQHPEGARRPDIYRLELENELEQMEYAEELGFDSVWLAEHHFSEYSMMSDAMLLASHVAARTRRVRIGVAVSVLPFHNPIRLAEQTAAVDCLSNGRLDHGVGRGYQPEEFRGFGISMAESRARFDECLEIMLKAWTQERFSHQGRFFQIPEISVYPRPLQQPYPPLLVASVSDETIRATAARELPMLTGQVFLPLEATGEKLRLYRRALAAGGTAPERLERLTAASSFLRFVYVADTNRQAREEARTALMNYLRILTQSTLPPFAAALPEGYADYDRRAAERTSLRFEALWEESLIFGDPDRCAEKIRQLQRMGVGSLLCWMVFGGLEHHKVLHSMELFARYVMPQFRAQPALALV